MPISPAIAKALNAQVALELHASATYLQLASTVRKSGCVKLCELYRKASAEEREHAEGLARFLDQRGADVALGAIEAPKAVSKLVDAAKAVLALEERVTASLQAIHKAADEAGDGQTCSLMLRYLDEQTEGEDQARQVLAFFQAAGDVATFDQQCSTLL